MKTMDNVKRRIITSMIAILLLIITLFGITYAYFVARVEGNNADKSVSVSAGKLELTYSDNNDILTATHIIPGTVVGEKEFTVTNTGTAYIDSYEVIIENITNTLDNYEDLTYVLTCTSSDEKECFGSEGVFPKTKSSLTTNSIDKDEIHTYKIVLTFNETNKDQSIDMNKEVIAKINIEDDEITLKNLIIYGNSIQEGTLSPSNPIEIESLGDRTSNLLDVPRDLNFTQYYNVKVNIPAGTYKIMYDSWSSVNSSGEIGRPYLRFSNTNTGVHLSEYNNYVDITLEQDVNEIHIYAYSYGYANSAGYKVNIKNLMIVPSTATVVEYEPYGKYKIPISIKGNNLFNKDVVTDNKSLSNGNLVDNNEKYVSDYINCGEIESISINLVGSISWYDENKNVISYENTSTTMFRSYSVPEKAIYFRVDFNKKIVNSNEVFIIGGMYTNDTMPNYEQYTEPLYKILYLDEPLRKLGDCNKCTDFIDFANKRIVRYVGEYKFTGSEYWDTYYNVFFTTALDSKAKRMSTNVLNTHYVASPNIKISDILDKSTVIGDGKGSYYIRDNSYSDVTSFKAFLTNEYNKGTPVTLNYLFNNDSIKIEKVDLPDLSKYYKDSKLIIGTSLEPSKIFK